MAKKLFIVQGIYKVGTDFPEGSFIFDSNEEDTEIEMDLPNEDFFRFYLDKKHGYSCRLNLKKGDKLTIRSNLYVTKVEMLDFSDNAE